MSLVVLIAGRELQDEQAALEEAALHCLQSWGKNLCLFFSCVSLVVFKQPHFDRLKYIYSKYVH